MITQKIIARTDSLKLDKIISRYGEDSMRQVVFIIVRPEPDSEELIPITIPEDAVGTFRILKPSGNFVIVPMSKSILESGETAFDVVLPASANTAKGSGYYDIRITSESDKYYYTAQGDFLIDDNIISDEVLEDVSEVNGLVFPDDFLTVEDHVAYIDDDTISTDSTWSSQNIHDEIELQGPSNTASGNPITFTDGADAPFYKFNVNFMYKQAGSGDPSPDNIRPITPYSDIDIDIADSSTGTPTTNNIDFGWTYGGGYVDLVHGKLVVTHYYEVFDGTATVGFGRNGYSNWYYTITGTVVPGTLGIIPTSNKYVGINVTNTNDVLGIYKIPNLGQVRVRIGGEQPDDISSFIADLSTTPLQVISPLSTPIEISLPPAQIRSLIGSNYIITTGDSMDITYFKLPYQSLIDFIEANSGNYIYSSNEQVVGKWIDGSVVYEKTLYQESLNVSRSDWSILDTITADKFIDSSVTFINNGRYLDKTYMRISYLNGNIYYHTPEINGTCDDVYVTIRYTKEV